MSFRFNFFQDQQEEEPFQVTPTTNCDIKGFPTKEETFLEADENDLRVIFVDPVEIIDENVGSTDPIVLFKRSLSDVAFEFAQNDSLSETTNNESKLNYSFTSVVHGQTDLIAGVYEGGLKTWECSYDLVCYLKRTILSSEPQIVLEKGARVLEVGCGSALPGIFLMKYCHDVATVDYQDYNSEVIQSVTMPNILVNTKYYSDILVNEQLGKDAGALEVEMDMNQLARVERCGKFFSGDWSSFDQVQNEYDYDLILTSETIYSEESYPKLCRLLTQKLKFKSGIALVACKSFYFGCGGNSIQFTRYIENNSKRKESVSSIDDKDDGLYHLKCEKVAQLGNTDSLLREIWLIKWAPF